MPSQNKYSNRNKFQQNQIVTFVKKNATTEDQGGILFCVMILTYSDYLFRLMISANISSVVVIVFELAEKPRWVVIILTNS